MIEDDEPTGKAKGGHARAERLSPSERSEIAKKAAEARWKAGPLDVTEDAETGDRFVLYTKSDGVEFQLRFEGEEPWATQDQIARLFGVDRSVVSKHIKNVFGDGELSEETTCAFLAHMGQTGQRYKTKIYGLDVILAVGYRVGSREAIMFRRWANSILRQYLIYGFVIDQPRLENPDDRPDYFQDLLEKIRSIRASEKRMWTRLLELASFCSDYSMMTDADRQDLFATLRKYLPGGVYSKVQGSSLRAPRFPEEIQARTRDAKIGDESR